MTREERVAKLMEDDHLTVRVKDMQLSVKIRVPSSVDADALFRLTGHPAQGAATPGGVRYWATRNEAVLLRLFEGTAPYLTRRQDLVRACLQFLRCQHVGDLLAASLDISRLNAEGNADSVG